MNINIYYRMEIMELKDHPFYAAVQYHPEYLSRPMRPSPPYTGLNKARENSKKLKNDIFKILTYTLYRINFGRNW